jgi:hypothetical protein
VHVTLFGPISGAESAALTAAVRRFGRFLELPADLALDRTPGG